jgi:hypothetical protein
MSGRIDRKGAYVDHELILVRVAEENIGDYVWAVAVDDLVEEINWVGERV